MWAGQKGYISTLNLKSNFKRKVGVATLFLVAGAISGAIAAANYGWFLVTLLIALILVIRPDVAIYVAIIYRTFNSGYWKHLQGKHRSNTFTIVWWTLFVGEIPARGSKGVASVGKRGG